MTGQKPSGGGNQRNGHDHRDKYSGDSVRQAGNGRFGAAGFLHQTDDLGEGGVLAYLVGPEFEESGSAHCGSCYGVARAFFDRHALTSEGALVHRGPSLQHGAVYWDPAAGSDQDGIAHLDLGSGNFYFFSLVQDRGSFGSQIHELADGVSGFPLARVSRYFPRVMRVRIIAADSK